MHMSTPTSIDPKVTSSSFQTDAAIVWQKRCRNRDLRPILSLEPTGFGGFNSQATTKPPTGPHSTTMHTHGKGAGFVSSDITVLKEVSNEIKEEVINSFDDYEETLREEIENNLNN